MKLMPALPESIFDVAYLIFAITSGALLLRKAAGRREIRLMGWAVLLLGCGDAFHLIPRVFAYWVESDLTAALGIGKLVTSVTMTVFYLLLEYVREERYHAGTAQSARTAVWILTVLRIVLCVLPQNGWTSPDAPFSWGIIRNIPFAVTGILTVILWYKDAKADRPVRFLYLAVALSFVFYLLVVVLAGRFPMTGMLMLPKTVMYIWIICMFRKILKEGTQLRSRGIPTSPTA